MVIQCTVMGHEPQTVSGPVRYAVREDREVSAGMATGFCRGTARASSRGRKPMGIEDPPRPEPRSGGSGLRGVCLDVPHRIGDGDGRCQSRQDMHMVCHASDFDEISFKASNCAANVFVKPILKRFSNGRLTILRAEDHVVGEFRICAHVCSRRFAAGSIGIVDTMGSRPRLHAYAASRHSQG